MTTEVARLDGVTKAFRGVTALDGVSLTVGADEALGLIGPNGSGKTTLINVLSGVLAPSAGTISVAGVDATRRPAHRVAALGVGRTFQQVRLFRTMTARQNVELGALARGHGWAGAAAADELLERMGLGAHAERQAGTLDYGSQRRLEIARALAGRPRLLLLDEPAAGMNERESDDLLAAIVAAQEQAGCAVLVVEHDLRLIMRLCSRIHVLAEGRTICEGTPAEVQRDRRVIDAYLGTASGRSAEHPQPSEEEERA